MLADIHNVLVIPCHWLQTLASIWILEHPFLVDSFHFEITNERRVPR